MSLLSAGWLAVDDLKARILPDAAAALDTWDTALEALGKAVARKLGRWCNRDFDREADVVETVRGGQGTLVLRRYPVEEIDTLEVLDPDGDSETVDSGDYQLRAASGLIRCSYVLGGDLDQIRVTYTGGYWLDDGQTMPTGATPLPEDLTDAFVMQAQAEAEHRELFRTVGLRREQREAGEARLTDLRVIPAVAEILNPYRRLAG